MRKQNIVPGSRVRLTSEFLRNTVQVVGGEGHKRWTVMQCCCNLCTGGEFVALNETSMFSDALRHILKENLEVTLRR